MHNIDPSYEALLKYNVSTIKTILEKYGHVLNMQTNGMCRKIKLLLPNIPDEHIQAHVFTVQQLLLMELYKK